MKKKSKLKSKAKAKTPAKKKPKTKVISYATSGVDVVKGDALVDWLQESAKNQQVPFQDQVVAGIGGFASLFRLPNSNMKNPCLVTCTDGVGTKVKLASHFGSYREVAQDCVAMCVNDLICTGGQPLLFLDYYATGKLNLKNAKEFLQGIREACHKSHCALVGGETAEMPGVYAGEDFDCAGFAVGLVDEEQALGAHRVRAGDKLIGVSSSGFHSNGYSFLRKIFAKDLSSWKKELLEPTALYVELMRQLQKQNIELHAAAHITGGGVENIPRVLPENLEWQPRWWKFPKNFLEVQKRSGLSDKEMRVTLNCGVGFVLVLPEKFEKKAQEIIREQGFQSFDLGELR